MIKWDCSCQITASSGVLCFLNTTRIIRQYNSESIWPFVHVVHFQLHLKVRPTRYSMVSCTLFHFPSVIKSLFLALFFMWITTFSGFPFDAWPFRNVTLPRLPGHFWRKFINIRTSGNWILHIKNSPSKNVILDIKEYLRSVILTPGPGEPQGVLVLVFALLSAPIQIQETRWVELIDQLKQLITQLRAKQQQKPAHPAALQDQEWGSLS